MRLLTRSQIIAAALSLCLSSAAAAINIGEPLKPLQINSTPSNFDYKPDGKHQLILIYSLELSARAVGKFHHKVIMAGFCPKSIVDMNKRAWYAPLSLAESELEKEVKNSQNPKCSVTADYNNITTLHWKIDDSPTTIVVNGAGIIVFFEHGLLDKNKEEQVLNLLQKDLSQNPIAGVMHNS